MRRRRITASVPVKETTAGHTSVKKSRGQSQAFMCTLVHDSTFMHMNQVLSGACTYMKVHEVAPFMYIHAPECTFVPSCHEGTAAILTVGIRMNASIPRAMAGAKAPSESRQWRSLPGPKPAAASSLMRRPGLSSTMWVPQSRHAKLALSEQSGWYAAHLL